MTSDNQNEFKEVSLGMGQLIEKFKGKLKSGLSRERSPAPSATVVIRGVSTSQSAEEASPAAPVVGSSQNSKAVNIPTSVLKEDCNTLEDVLPNHGKAEQPLGTAVRQPVDALTAAAELSNDVDPVVSTAILATEGQTRRSLNSSPLWERAYEKVTKEPDWTKYTELVNKNTAIAKKNADGSDEIISIDRILTIAETLSEQVESSKAPLQIWGRSISIRKSLDSTVDVLAVLKDVGASATSLNPYASVAWGGLQFFVQAAVTYKEVAALCWDELPRMARLTSQYQTFEVLYKPSQLGDTGVHLENALVELFSAILRYQVVIVKYASRRKDQVKTSFQGKAASLPQRVLDYVKKWEDEVAKVQVAADREISDMNFQRIFDNTTANTEKLREVSRLLRKNLSETESMQNRTAAHLETVSAYLEEMQRDKILEWISTIKYANAHNSKGKSAIAGTGGWLTMHRSYLDWRSSKRPLMFWLHGFMGSGKSWLAHAVIEDIKSNAISRNGAVGLAYFYCDGSSVQEASDIANAENILRCLAKQLSHVGNAGRLMDNLTTLYQTTHQQGDISDKQCKALLQDLINESEKTVIIIDGLDECLEDVQSSLMTAIVSLTELCTSPLLTFISSRQTRFISDLFKDHDPTELDTEQNNSTDLAKFVATTAKEAAATLGLQTRYHNGSESLENAVVQKILGSARGMFLWAQFAFKYLHDSQNFKILRRRLEQLDHLDSLFDLYDKIYANIMKRHDEPERLAVRTLLSFVVHGYEGSLDSTVVNFVTLLKLVLSLLKKLVMSHLIVRKSCVIYAPVSCC
jgi:hypothetical protein